MSVPGKVKFYNETKGYATQPVTNTPINTNVACDSVNTPIIFEPPSALAGSTPQVWIAVSGGSSGGTDPNWGGCNVWLSTDGTPPITRLAPSAGRRPWARSRRRWRISPATNPDTTDALAVNLAEGGGTLATSTDLNAQLAIMRRCTAICPGVAPTFLKLYDQALSLESALNL